LSFDGEVTVDRKLQSAPGIKGPQARESDL